MMEVYGRDGKRQGRLEDAQKIKYCSTNYYPGQTVVRNSPVGN